MDNIEQIQLFLQGRLDGDALRRFEEQLKQDKDLQKTVSEYDTIFKGFGQLRNEKISQQVKGWSKDLPPLEVEKERPMLRRVWLQRAAVAAVVVIALAGLGKWFFGAEAPLQKFGEEHYVALALGLEKSEVKDPDLIAFRIAEFLFKTEAYQDCIDQLSQFDVNNPFYLKALYLKGHALYRTKKYRAAIQTFEQLEQLPPSEKFNTRNYSSDNATWTKILAQLALYKPSRNSSPEKTSLLKEVNAFLNKSPSTTYKKKAEALLALLAAD